MTDDPVTAQADIASYAPGAADADDAFGDVGWWLTGGMSLLAWTGIALLLTAA